MKTIEINEIAKVLENRLQMDLPAWSAHKAMATALHKRARVAPPKVTRKAGVLMLLFPHEDQLWMPLILRTTYNGVHSGQMALPGGKVELSDRDIIDTALRETLEEIGVQVGREQVIGILSDIYIPASNISVTPVLAFMDHKPAYLLDRNEVDGVTDISIPSLQNPANHAFKQVSVVNGLPLRAPAFEIHGCTIWGATAMMLSELLQLFQELD